MNRRLADFIRAEMEPILQGWEDFAKSILLAEDWDVTALRDHARDMLLDISNDLDSPQSEAEQAAKSKGRGPEAVKESGAKVHGGDRQTSGFSVIETVSEFRALRASVVSLWTKAYPTISGQQLEDVTRFHEAIDQAVAESLEQYAAVKEMETRLFGAILLASPDPIYVLDLAGRFVYANKSTADLFALEPKEIIGKTTFDLGFSSAPDFQRNLDKVIADQSPLSGKFIHTCDSDQRKSFGYQLAPVLDVQGNTEAIVCISRDITEQELATATIWHHAHHDLLTGLPNRRLFLDRLEQEIKHAQRNNLSLALLFLDLNDFKDVNDSHGHEAGDHLLSRVAKRLTDCVRADDTVARIGGDEFTVILSDSKQRADVELVAQTIIDALALPFQVAQQSVQIAVSIGISLYPQDATSPAALLEAADQAMYKAKKSGFNRMCFVNTSEPSSFQ